MRSLLRSFFIIFLLVPLYAAQKDMSIVVGTYKSNTTAATELLRLEKSMHKRADIVGLKQKYGFDYTLQRVGKFNRVVITPFKEMKVLERMLHILREQYHDAYVLSGKRGRAVIKIPVETEAQRAERIAAADMAFDEGIEDTLPIVPYFSQSTSSKVAESVEKSVARTDWSEHIKDENNMYETASGAVSTRSANSNLMLYAVIGVLLVITILGSIMFWSKKRVKRRRRTHREVVDIGVPPVAGHSSYEDS